jgi:glycosyltransferase involved in cell wall biosynthesis
MVHLRVRRYADLTMNADVVHFHQTLNAYGSKAVFDWLNRPSKATRIVTVHELDADQLEGSGNNSAYNRADGIIVHCREMRQQLTRMAVQPEKIHVVLHGATIPPMPADGKRDGVVFYGGHKLMSSKGIGTLFQAMAMVQRRMGKAAPLINIHGHYGNEAPPEAIRLADQYGIGDRIVWLNQLPEAKTIELYRQSMLCVLPYVGSFAGWAASLAAACALPVVGTRRAGLPDHLGDAGIWIDDNSPDQLAGRIIDLCTSPQLRCEAGARLRCRAEQLLDWGVIAEKTLAVYEESMNARSHRRPKVPAVAL